MRTLHAAKDSKPRLQGKTLYYVCIDLWQGRWTIPKIPNPDYKGPWTPAQIPNPAYFEDSSPSDFSKIAGIGIELWTMTEDILCESSPG